MTEKDIRELKEKGLLTSQNKAYWVKQMEDYEARNGEMHSYANLLKNWQAVPDNHGKPFPDEHSLSIKWSIDNWYSYANKCTQCEDCVHCPRCTDCDACKDTFKCKYEVKSPRDFYCAAYPENPDTFIYEGKPNAVMEDKAVCEFYKSETAAPVTKARTFDQIQQAATNQ